MFKTLQEVYKTLSFEQVSRAISHGIDIKSIKCFKLQILAAIAQKANNNNKHTWRLSLKDPTVQPKEKRW